MSDIAIKRGEKRTFQTTVQPLGASGLDAYPSIIFTVKDRLDRADADAKIQKKLGVSNDIVVSQVGDANTAGIILTTVRYADTSSFPPYRVDYEWDIQISDGTSEPIVVDSGTFTVKAHATASAT